MLNRIISRLSYPFRLLGNELSITVSLGVSSVSEQTSDISQLLHQADLAMYQAKRNGRSRIVSYSDDCINQNWNSPEEMLARALREGRIVPYFQPVIRLQDSRLTGLEVMARWLTEEGILKDAFDFIPLAEQCGLILELDYQILRHTCQQLKNWLPISGQSKFKVAINLSGKHLVNHDHIMRLMGIIEEEGVAPGYLILNSTSGSCRGKIPMRWHPCTSCAPRASRSASTILGPASPPSTPCSTSRWITSRWMTALPSGCCNHPKIWR